MNTRSFHLGDILSITTGRLVSPSHMSGVYNILNFMSGDNLFTHQLPRVGREAAPHLLKQFPQLAGISGEDLDARLGDLVGEERNSAVREWLAEQERKFGTWFDVTSMAEGAHEHVDPVEELVLMVAESHEEKSK